MQDISKQEFIVFTASSMVLLALGIDIMLPAFAEVRKHFGIAPDSIMTSNIVAFFFMGQITQIFFGYLTDRFGRIPIIRTGIIIYILSGIAAVYAPVIELMFLFRFLAGVGAAAVVMTAIASVRDRYAGDDMAKIMSFVFTIFLSVSYTHLVEKGMASCSFSKASVTPSGKRIALLQTMIMSCSKK